MFIKPILEEFFLFFKKQPRQTIPINTYVSHPWVFIDNFTGQLLHVRHKPVLYGREFPTRAREKVCLHLPMKRLQNIVMESLLTHLNSVDVVDQLEIPEMLKRELRHVFRISATVNEIS